MPRTRTTTWLAEKDPEGPGLSGQAACPTGERTAETSRKPRCFHCGADCGGAILHREEKLFCCRGCLTVFELLTDHGLGEFYQLSETAGVRVRAESKAGQFRFLDEPAVRERLVHFSDARLTRVTFRVPAIHCLACVWLLENLFRLKPGIGKSQVNFPRKEVALSFHPAQVRLSEVVALLTSLGYEPELKLSDLESRPKQRVARRLWLQLGVAGFAFGNAMLFSLAGYFGLDAFSGPAFRQLTGWLCFLLAIPVVVFSAADYWRSAWTSVRQRVLNIDVPIAAGIAALFTQSALEVVAGRGVGYFDSLCGLLFFLLCGKLFQQKTYDRLAFDRDYKSFFPLSVTRKQTGAPREEHVSLAQLQVGDRLIIRNGELIPADARLIEGPALVDYSFVTGESEPVEKRAGDGLFAGGRQMGGAIEVEMVKTVSQSYLTTLWNQDAFRKDTGAWFDRLTNRYSQRFTKLVIVVAVGTAAFWAIVDPAIALKAFTSVLIVACPCALALAAPFALGTAQRVLARKNLFLKNPQVLETLARVDAVVFDKTGTLTVANAGAVEFEGEPLSADEERWLFSMTRHSTHPYAVRIGEAIARNHFPDYVRSFLETAGCGMEGSLAGHEIWMGSAHWLEARGAVCRRRGDESQTSSTEKSEPPHVVSYEEKGSIVHVAMGGKYRGAFVLANALRPEADRLITELSANHELALLSGDNEMEREKFRAIFGDKAHLQFNQNPLDKLEFIHGLQRCGRTVMMVGDGLNDAGALQQSDVGVAVVENLGTFSPASDAILAATMVPCLAEMLSFARQSVRVVRASFLISAAYNIVGIGIAARGLLSPVVCAILMPLSSVTVVAFACGVTAWLGRKRFEPRSSRRQEAPSESRIPNPELRNDQSLRTSAATKEGVA